MTGLLMVGSGIKIFRRERDLLILTGGMRDKLTAGCEMGNHSLQTLRGELQLYAGGIEIPQTGLG